MAQSQAYSTGRLGPVTVTQTRSTTAQSRLVGSDTTPRALGNSLTTVGGGTTDHTPVGIRTCTGSVGQKWERHGTISDSLRNPNAGHRLDVVGFQTGDGARPGLWECNGLSNQQWVIPA